MITPVKNPQDLYFINLFNMVINRSGIELDMDEDEIESYAYKLNEGALALNNKLRDEELDPSLIENQILSTVFAIEGDYYLSEIKRLIQFDYMSWFDQMEGEGLELSRMCRRIKRYLEVSIGIDAIKNRDLGEIELLGYIQKFYEENVLQQKTSFRAKLPSY